VESTGLFLDKPTASAHLKAGARTFLPDDLHAELAAEIRNDDVDDVVARVSSFVRDRVAYVTGSTHVTTTALESWTQKSGVCQDLSHLMISFLRGRRIPARYVSGYLHPQADPTIGETVLGQSHAWVEYFCGEWVGVDPTNGKIGDVVVVTGENLQKANVSKVYLTDGKNDLVAEVLEQTDTTIKFKIPAKATGRMAVMVLTTGKDAQLIEQPVKVTIDQPGTV